MKMKKTISNFWKIEQVCEFDVECMCEEWVVSHASTLIIFAFRNVKKFTQKSFFFIYRKENL